MPRERGETPGMLGAVVVRKQVQAVLVKPGGHTQLEAVALARREGIFDRA